MANYSYPRVDVTTKALKHSVGTETVEDTTTLFVPILAERGPINEVVAVHSLSEYISKFGELNYEKQGQTALNLMNWLLAGGTAYIYRLTAFTTDDIGSFEATGYDGSITMKYPGEFYNSCKVYVETATKERKITKTTADDGSITNINTYISLKYKVTVKDSSGNTLEVFYIKYDDKDVSSKSEFIEKIDITEFNTTRAVTTAAVEFTNKIKYDMPFAKLPETLSKDDIGSETQYIDITDKGFSIVKIIAGVDGEPTPDSNNASIEGIKKGTVILVTSDDEKMYIKVTGDATNKVFPYELATVTAEGTFSSLLNKFWVSKNTNGETVAEEYLLNQLETPIDMILDAGYTSTIKKAICKFITEKRTDIIGIFDMWDAYTDTTKLTEVSDADLLDTQTLSDQITNYAVYAQKFVISEETLSTKPKDIWVTPTYFLASLIPYNDLTYGIQMPVAGQKRGVLQGVKKIDVNPLPAKKEDYFQDRINYVEKDTRGYYFMSQRTHDKSTASSYTALSFLNNSRVKCKMVRELEKIGREYLFEFNDSVTLSQLSAALNSYVTTWIANRTLDKGYVEVKKSELSDEAVDVTLNIRFTGTIEVISVDITIE